MIKFLIILIATAIVALGWYGLVCLKKLTRKSQEKKNQKRAAEIAAYNEEVERIKQRYLAEDKVVNLDEIEAEVRGKKFNLADALRGVWTKIKSFLSRYVFHYIGIGWHYFCYIFWPLKWVKKRTYDKLRYEHQKVFISVLFLLPTILGFLIFFIYPLIMSFIYSLSTLELVQGGPIIHFGQAFTQDAIQNKNYLVTDPSVKTIFFNYVYALRENADFPVQLLNTCKDTVIDTVVITIFSLIIAVVLNGDFKGRGIVRAIFFLPVIFNSEAVNSALESASSLSTLAGQTGSNALSNLFNMETFLISLKVPKVLVTFLNGITSTIYDTISYSGIQILIFLAAIQSVPKHLYEAAKIEGATKYESFWKITLPMVSPMIIIVMVYTIVDSFLRSEINDVIDLQYKNSAYGRHAAMSWIYFLSAVLILVVMIGIVSRFVFYYDDKK